MTSTLCPADHLTSCALWQVHSELGRRGQWEIQPHDSVLGRGPRQVRASSMQTNSLPDTLSLNVITAPLLIVILHQRGHKGFHCKFKPTTSLYVTSPALPVDITGCIFSGNRE